MPDRSKLLRSLVAVVLLVLALPLGVYLSQRKQIYKSKASSPGDCRCDGNNIICETENGFEFKGEDPSCTTGTPPVFTKEENPQGEIVQTTWVSTSTTGSNTGITAVPQPTPITPVIPPVENICFLPGMNCVGDDWTYGVELAKKPASAIKDNKNPALVAKLKEQIKDPEFTKNNPDVVNALIESDSSLKQTVGTQTAPTVSSEANALRDAKTKECSVTLGLCPMIDPVSLKVVGWVPSDKAVFGTFTDAIVARSGLSIGDATKTIEINKVNYKVYDPNYSLENALKVTNATEIKRLQTNKKSQSTLTEE